MNELVLAGLLGGVGGLTRGVVGLIKNHNKSSINCLAIFDGHRKFIISEI